MRPAISRTEGQEPEYSTGPPHSCAVATALCRRDLIRPDRPGRLQCAKKLLRKKKNESWAMRPRPNKSDSRELEVTCYAKSLMGNGSRLSLAGTLY